MKYVDKCRAEVRLEWPPFLGRHLFRSEHQIGTSAVIPNPPTHLPKILDALKSYRKILGC